MFDEDARSSAEDLLGRLVDDRYKILEAMASGSMGAVFKAERVPVGKLVAIKFLHAGFAHEAEFLTRFERETRVMSKLAHPNCVSVVDFGVWEGAPYLVMEHVAGKTLRAVLDGGPMEPMRALGLARQIAAGLAHAHAQGVTHRDVKPANIMITEEIGAGEHVRILDFGLARLRGAVGRDATQTNVVVGTPNYMAPEQTVGGSTIDARTDVYAVGVVLFEMIAGARPFIADDTLALLGMHRAAPIPKLADRVDRTIILPAGLQDVLETAMAKSPEDRYQSAIELATAIDQLTNVSRTPPPGSIVVSPSKRSDPAAVAPTVTDVRSQPIERPPPTRSRVPILLVLLVLVGGAGAAWYLKQTDRPGSDPDRGSAARPLAGGGSGNGSGSAPDVAVVTIDASPVVEIIADATELSGSGSGSGSDEITGAGSGSGEGSGGGSGELVAAGSGSGIGSGSASGSASDEEIEIEPNPDDAKDPIPEDPNKPAAEDEAEDAPKTADDAETHAPVVQALATTIHDAVVLIQQGKNELALASLRAIWKKAQNSAYVPFLLGNLYFDKRWWSVAMDHYRIAISKNAGYKKNPTLNRNIIRMLGSAKTNGKAQYFLKKTIGRASRPYLRSAAANEKNPHVKKWAAYLAKNIK